MVQATSKSCLLAVIAVFAFNLTILIAIVDLISETDVWGAIADFFFAVLTKKSYIKSRKE